MHYYLYLFANIFQKVVDNTQKGANIIV